MISSIGLETISPTNIRKMPHITATVMAVCTASPAFSPSLRPIKFAMTTLAPTDRPIKRLSIRLIIGPLQPTAAVAGSAISLNFENFTYFVISAFSQATVTFTSQNYGANKMDRVKRVFIICMGTVTVIGIALGGIAYLAGNTLLGIYSSSAEVISYGMIRLKYICILYFLCGLMDTIVGASRGLGSSLVPAIVSLIGACGLRIVWIYTLFRMDKTLENLYLSYPVTWFVTAAAQFVFFVFIFTKIKKTITKTLG